DAVDLSRVVEREDVRVGERRDDPDLPQESIDPELTRSAGVHDLDRDSPIVPEIAGEEHRRHASATDLALELVAAREHLAETGGGDGHGPSGSGQRVEYATMIGRRTLALPRAAPNIPEAINGPGSNRGKAMLRWRFPLLIAAALGHRAIGVAQQPAPSAGTAVWGIVYDSIA